MPAGVERMDVRWFRTRSQRKRRMYSFWRRALEVDGADADGERGSKGVGRLEGKEVEMKGFSF